MQSKQTKTAIVAHDIHYPKVNRQALRCFLSFLAENPPDYFVFGGDQLDMASISHHNKKKPLFKGEAAYLRDIRGFDDAVLKPIEALIGKDCEKHWIIGNHERFEQDLVEEQPELSELVDHVSLLGLEKRGWAVTTLGHSVRIGKLTIVHGEILTGIGNQAGAFPSKKAVELYAGNVLAGHTHAPQSFTRVSPVNYREKWMGWIAPVLCDCNPSYLRNRPTAWVNGFTLVEFHPNGCFNLFPLVISQGRVAYAGKIYQG